MWTQALCISPTQNRIAEPMCASPKVSLPTLRMEILQETVRMTASPQQPIEEPIPVFDLLQSLQLGVFASLQQSCDQQDPVPCVDVPPSPQTPSAPRESPTTISTTPQTPREQAQEKAAKRAAAHEARMAAKRRAEAEIQNHMKQEREMQAVARQQAVQSRTESRSAAMSTLEQQTALAMKASRSTPTKRNQTPKKKERIEQLDSKEAQSSLFTRAAGIGYNISKKHLR